MQMPADTACCMLTYSWLTTAGSASPLGVFIPGNSHPSSICLQISICICISNSSPFPPRQLTLLLRHSQAHFSHSRTLGLLFSLREPTPRPIAPSHP
ncbi:hypothetical protein EDB80DRAFT_710129 [Ilyonectria destructans]|nr:hypothetical protein EDB80DRAFT_710129 [Ilyonectria destructans]